MLSSLLEVHPVSHSYVGCSFYDLLKLALRTLYVIPDDISNWVLSGRNDSSASAVGTFDVPRFALHSDKRIVFLLN